MYKGKDMEEPKALSSEKRIELFRNRGMCIDDENINKIQHINYYKLKEFAHPLSTVKKENGLVKISYENVKFKDVLSRYYQDKNLRIHLMHAIEKIEVSVKTNLARILGLRYGAFGYLDFNRWANRKKNTTFTIEKKQHRIKLAILKAKNKNKLAELSNKNNLDKDEFPTIWLTIDLLTFGEIVEIIELMSENNLEQLAKVYNCKKQELVSWLGCIQFIRNICAHNSNLIDIKLTTKPKIRKGWEERLYFIEKDGSSKPTDRLAVVLLVVMELVKQINARYKWGEIQKSINSICKDDKRANLLGFKSKEASMKLCKFIMKTN